MRTLFFPIFLSTFILSSCKTLRQKNIQFTTLISTSESWDGTKLPKYADKDPEITIIKVVIPGKTKLAWHKHPNINAGILLKGKLSIITVNRDTLRLKAGDPIVEVVNTWHYGINENNKPAEIVVFYAGTKSTPLSIKKD